jgi:transposase InsO family protein
MACVRIEQDKKICSRKRPFLPPPPSGISDHISDTTEYSTGCQGIPRCFVARTVDQGEQLRTLVRRRMIQFQ